MSSQLADEIADMALTTKPWIETERFYRGLVDDGLGVRAMLRLVEQIRASQYAQALHAWTSMHDLCIVQVPCTYPYDGPYLRVTPLFDGCLEFRCIDTPVEEKQWRRRVSEEAAYQRLERFIDQLHWVVRERAAAP